MGGEREAPAPARGVTITRQVAGGAHRERHRVTIASAHVIASTFVRCSMTWTSGRRRAPGADKEAS
jgi:hypothetical protein